MNLVYRQASRAKFMVKQKVEDHTSHNIFRLSVKGTDKIEFVQLFKSLGLEKVYYR